LGDICCGWYKEYWEREEVVDDMLDEKGIEVVGGLLSLSLSEVLLLKGVSLGEEARFAGEPRDDAEEAIIESKGLKLSPLTRPGPRTTPLAGLVLTKRTIVPQSTSLTHNP
jgi:hypothetical protein